MSESHEAAPEGEDKAHKADGDDAQNKAAKSDSKVSRSISVDSDDSLVKKDVDDRIPEESGSENRIGEWRHMRRIIAEDPEWSLATVPLLKELVVKHIADNFETNSSIMDSLMEKQQQRVLAKISTKLPLEITAVLVEDEGFWERSCRARWEICDVSFFDNCWKQMYMERNLQQIIEFFVPNTTNPELLENTLKLSEKFVKKLKIGQLLPPVRVAQQEPDFDDSSDVDEFENEITCDHFNFGPILPKLPFLEELHLCYGVRDCGMNFEWNLFQFTARDCLQLAQSVAACKTLKVLRIQRSKMNDDKVRVLISHILGHPGLQELDLANNIIGDRGARAIGKFLNNQSNLTKLNLCDNQIRIAGGQAIGFALTRNTSLVQLNVRLNRLGDEGGQAICKALLKNRSIVDVNLGSNDLAEPCASIMAQVFVENNVLRRADLSCNRLGPDGGKQLQEGMEANGMMLHLDLRLTECGQEAEYCISQIIFRNQEADRLRRIMDNEPVNAQYRKKSYDPQGAHRYELPATAIIA